MPPRPPHYTAYGKNTRLLSKEKENRLLPIRARGLFVGGIVRLSLRRRGKRRTVFPVPSSAEHNQPRNRDQNKGIRRRNPRDQQNFCRCQDASLPLFLYLLSLFYPHIRVLSTIYNKIFRCLFYNYLAFIRILRFSTRFTASIVSGMEGFVADRRRFFPRPLPILFEIATIKKAGGGLCTFPHPFGRR